MRKLFINNKVDVYFRRGYYKSYLLLVCIISLCISCSQVSVQEYEQSTPKLDLRAFFDGELKAYGLVKNRSGLVTRRFTATIDASWQDEQGTLIEHFVFDDGEQQDRVWILTDQGDGKYSGTATDVIGEALGQVRGSVFQWEYRLEVPYKDDKIVVNLDDWLYLLDENRLINETQMTKFGFRVGQLTLFIEKV
jgi:hypothetical protein